MPIVAMQTSFRNQSGSAARTNEITFAPQDTFVTTALTWVSGGGAHAVGIANVRFRPRPDGEEVGESFGGWTSWRSAVYRDRMSSVTWGIATGADQQAQGLVTLQFW